MLTVNIGMHRRWQAAATLLALVCISAESQAQPQDAHLSWQFSTNNGTTWIDNSIEVNSTVPTVIRVRGVLNWTNGPTLWGFTGLSMDAYVQKADAVTTNDHIHDPYFRGSSGLGPFGNIAMHTIANIIKIDRPDDFDPPGMGLGWITPTQNPQFPEFTYQNPLSMIEYDYVLDGSLGIRNVSAAVRMRPEGSTQFWNPVQGVALFGPTSVSTGTITVIPAPAGLALVAMPVLAAARRRR